ncbi:hypothetical protein Zmor_016023 [Zophobas morio]|uniref:Uncharacterized protein n=1 Tax=Zophobas morio TaxID=2755281 RepID=A0AA38IHW7_9CUCU|nr:hypothetical protein Zmor_016023 [Zophobas morio]
MFRKEQCDRIENNNNSQIAMKRNCFQSLENDPVDQDEDLLNDLCTISYESKNFDRDIHLRSFASDDIFVEKGDLVRIRLNNTTKVIKKSSLCWLLDNEEDRVSVDRLKRFTQNKKCNSSRVNSETDTCLQHKDASQIQKPVQIGKQKRPYNISSDSSYLDNPSSIKYDDSTDTESLNSSNYSDDLNPRLNLKAENSKTDRSKPDLHIDDYIIVQLTTQKQNKKCYIGKVLSLNPIFCDFLKRNPKIPDVFMFPDIKDQGEIQENQYILKLPTPQVLRRGSLVFEKIDSSWKTLFIIIEYLFWHLDSTCGILLSTILLK